MARLIYLTVSSLDGYVSDRDGGFVMSVADDEVHTFTADLLRPVGTQLYGRRLYEVMSAWETLGLPGDPPAVVDFGEVWRGTDKVVYSTTLTEVAGARTRIEPEFDPDAVRELKATSEQDIMIGGPTLAASAFRAGLVDEVQLLLAPVIVGGGTRSVPDDVRLDLELLDERRFDIGIVYLRYRVLP